MAIPHTKSPEIPSANPALHGRHRLDQLDPTRVARHLVMFEPTEAVVEDLVAQARLAIPGLAETAEILRVFRHNAICVMALARKSRFESENPKGEGFVAVLPLNLLGLQLLALGHLDATHPDLRLIAKPHERPAGLYMWAVFAPGPLAAGMALFMERIASEQYAGLNLYSRPNTDAGRRFNEVLGAVEGVTIGGIEAPHVWMFPRKAERPLYDSYVPHTATKKLAVTVARTMEDLTRVIAIRSAVYIGEQECPYEEEYDGNDLAATHLLAYSGDEPAGCLRVRFFANFAKVERLAIRREFRKTRAAFQLVNAALMLCRKKGYRQAYGHSQMRLVNFWSRFGFHVPDGARHLVFSDFDYVEMVADLEPDPDAVSLSADPYVIIRPEGRWHDAGILEKSAARPVTRPSVQKTAQE